MGLRKIGIVLLVILLSSKVYGQGIGDRGLGTPRLIVKESAGAVTTTPRMLVFPDGALYQSGSSTHVHILTSAIASNLFLLLNQSTPQTVTGGTPIFQEGIGIGDSNKYLKKIDDNTVGMYVNDVLIMSWNVTPATLGAGYYMGFGGMTYNA